MNPTSQSVRWLCSLFMSISLSSFLPARADTLTNVFTGSIVLDGDISDFFEADGLTAKPGVCVANDFDGLAEPPTAGSGNQSNQDEPSGFNQRRIISAYNPTLNGGTIFIGIDLPGGTAESALSPASQKTTHSEPGNPNPNFNDGVVGFNGGGFGTGRGKILSFDADANGEADAIGRQNNGVTPLFRCPGVVTNLDIWECSGTSTGGTDDPRLASGEGAGAEESYVAMVLFGDGTHVSVEFFQDSFTPTGIAEVSVTSSAVPSPFGARVSTVSGGDGVPLGFDVEIALTSVNAAATNSCARLDQTLVVYSGSNRDGQGEDFNVLSCVYSLPTTVQCRVLFFTNNVQVITPCPGGTLPPIGVPPGTVVEARVVIRAASSNAQDITACNIDLNGAITTNITVSGALEPGDRSTNSVGTFIMRSFGVRNVNATIVCEGAITGDGECPPIQTSCLKSIESCRSCITRRPNYWFNHLKSNNPNCATLKKAIRANGGRLDLGFICLPTNGVANAEQAMRQALSFWPPSSTGFGNLCDARKRLAFHLIAANANNALFGTEPGNCPNGQGGSLPPDLIEMARRAGACSNVAAIRAITRQLEQFNNSGNDQVLPSPLLPCGLGGSQNQDSRRLNVYNSTNCGNTNHCGGIACP